MTAKQQTNSRGVAMPTNTNHQQNTMGTSGKSPETHSNNLKTMQQTRFLDQFFVIDSEHLDTVSTRLYGYCVTDDGIVFKHEDLDAANLSGDGCYVMVENDADSVTIAQDNMGCFGLYFYQESGFWCISNSFLLLVEWLKPRKSLSINKAYASALLVSELTSTIYGETLVNEVKWIDRRAKAMIDKREASISFEMEPQHEKSIPFDTEEGIRILDAWHDKWAALFRKMQERGEELSFELSGGFDSRCVFALALSSGIDLQKARILNYDRSDTYDDDRRIADMIVEHYGLALNKESSTVGDREPLPLFDSMVLDSLVGMGSRKYCKSRRFRLQTPQYKVGGYFGEHLRDFWGGKEDRFKATSGLAKSSWKKGFKELEESSVEAVGLSLERLSRMQREIGEPVGDEGLGAALFRETRCRSHFGHNIVNDSFSNIVKLCPLCDPLIQRLQTKSRSCADKHALYALVYYRYAKDLLDFPFDSGRTIEPETIRYVNGLCQRFPIKGKGIGPASHCLETFPSTRQGFGGQVSEVGKYESYNFKFVVQDLFEAYAIQHSFQQVFGSRMYGAIRNEASFPDLYAAFSIAFVNGMVSETSQGVIGGLETLFEVEKISGHNNTVFSVIIPHKDTPDLLQRCLDSIPVRDDVEAIVVDDNSDPDKVDFGRFPGLGRPNTKVYFTKEGKGPGYARNVGLDHARGRWIVFADADDFFAEDFNALLDEVADAKEDLIFFDYKGVFSDDITQTSTDKAWFRPYIAGYLKGVDVEQELRVNFVVPWSKIIRRELIERHHIRFEEIRWSEDVYFSAKVGYHAQTLRVSGKVGYVTTSRTGSVTDSFCSTVKEFRVRMTESLKVDKLFAGRYGFTPRSKNFLMGVYRRKGLWKCLWLCLRNVFHPEIFWKTARFLLSRIRKNGFRKPTPA